MAYDNIYLKGSTSIIVQVMLRDPTTGNGKTSVAYSAITAYYVRPGGTTQSITLKAKNPGDAYDSGGWAEVDGTNQKGVYQLHVPNACLATGANVVDISIQGTDICDCRVKIVLVDADLRNAANLGLTALPAVAPKAKGGLAVLSGDTGLDLIGFGDASLGLAKSAGTKGTDAIYDSLINGVNTNQISAAACQSIDAALGGTGSAVKGIKDQTDKLTFDANSYVKNNTYEIQPAALQSIDTRLSDTHGAGAWGGGASYDAIYCDDSGSIGGAGTPNDPIKYVDAAISLAVSTGLGRVYLVGSSTHNFNANCTGKTCEVIGINTPIYGYAAVDPKSKNIQGIRFVNCYIVGDFGSTSASLSFINCFINTFYVKNAGVFTIVGGTIDANDGTDGLQIPKTSEGATIKAVTFGIVGSNHQGILNCDAANEGGCSVSDSTGVIEIINLTGEAPHNGPRLWFLNCNVEIVIASSCTGGTIHIRGGKVKITDNSGGNCTVDVKPDTIEKLDNMITTV